MLKFLRKNSSLVLSTIFIFLCITLAFWQWDLQRYSDEFRILVCGDATSNMIIGASWPEELGRILQSQNPQKKIIVINEAFGGARSIEILTHLPKWLKKYSPHLVLVMTGIDDQNLENLYTGEDLNEFSIKDYSEFKKEIKKKTNPAYFQAKIFFEFHQYDKALEIYKDRVFNKLENMTPQEYTKAAWASIHQGDEKMAMDFIYKGLEIHHDHSIASGLVHMVFRQERGLRRNLLKTLLELTKKYPADNAISNDEKKFFNLVEHEITMPPTNSSPLPTQPKVTWDPFQNNFTQKSILEISRLVDNANSHLVVVNYPARDKQSLAQLFRERPQVLVLDATSEFAALGVQNLGRYFFDFFAGDTGHLNHLGSKLLAQSVARQLPLSDYLR